jgi:flagellar biosynthetic protein FliR
VPDEEQVQTMAGPWIPSVAIADVAVAAGVIARIAAAIAVGVLPVTSGVGFRVQAAVALGLSIAAFPAADAAAPTAVRDPLALLWIVPAEAAVGLALGAAAASVLAAAAWMGAILGSVTGLSWADDFTPEGDPQTAGVARLAWWTALAGFVAADGHLQVVAGLVESVRRLPIGAAVGADGLWVDGLTQLAATMPSVAFSLAVSLALPALAAVVAFHLVAAICVRTIRFDPGQGLLQAAASLVLFAAICIGTESWTAGFAALVQAPLERCFHDIHP